MVERIPFPINFENVFIITPLNISNIELKKDSDIDKLKIFNANI